MRLFEIQTRLKKTASQRPLLEGKEGKNVHLEHIEDLVYNEGYVGAQRALNYMEALRQLFAMGEGEPVKVTTKWDGSVAIISGIDPADGKFFVGKKSVFAKKNPEICKSLSDIKKFYGDRPNLAEKLKYALKYLPKLGIGNVLQGDLMFTPGDLKTDIVGDQECYVFTPNTITYAVPIQSELGKRIARAKIGIIFHTSYEGPSIAEMKASFGFSASGLMPNNDVWFDDAIYRDYTGVASLTPQEDARIKKILTAAATTFKKISEKDFNKVIFTGRAKTAGGEEMTEFAKFVKPFINDIVRTMDPSRPQANQVGDPTQFLKNFFTFYKGKMEDEIAKLKGGADNPAAQARIKKIQEYEKFMADHANTLLGILAIYKRIVEAKLEILKKIQRVENIGTFIKTDTGYKVTAPEGFVAIGHDGGAVKLVDRIEFSRANFNAVKTWKQD